MAEGIDGEQSPPTDSQEGVDHERHDDWRYPPKSAAAYLIELVAQPLLGVTLGHISGGWAPPLRPGRSNLLLDLATVRKAVLGIPDRPALSLHAKDVAAGRLQGL